MKEVLSLPVEGGVFYEAIVKTVTIAIHGAAREKDERLYMSSKVAVSLMSSVIASIKPEHRAQVLVDFCQEVKEGAEMIDTYQETGK